jgi:hypothetical protein
VKELPVVVPPTFDDITTLSWALAALRQANDRHQTARYRFDDDAAARPEVYASMAEATWWIAALDERLWHHHKTDYQIIRRSETHTSSPAPFAASCGLAIDTRCWALQPPAAR